MLPRPVSASRLWNPRRCPFSPRSTTTARVGLCIVGALVIVSVFLTQSTEPPPRPPPPPPRFNPLDRHNNQPSLDPSAAEPNPFSVYATRLEDETWESRSRPSFLWSPMVVRHCTHLMPSWFAPCVAARSPYRERLYAEELIYPDFVLPIPLFANEEQKSIWLEAARTQPRSTYQKQELGEFMAYKSQHGQNFVLHDVEYTPIVTGDTWALNSCMQPHARLNNLPIVLSNKTATAGNSTTDATTGSNSLPLKKGSGPSSTKSESAKSAIVVNSPDSWSFQHFMDRVTHIIAQSAHLSLSEPRPTAYTGKNGSELVNQLWDRMGFTDREYDPRGTFSLERLFWSCKAVLIHPYLSWKAMEMMGMPWTSPNWTDKGEKKTILYMSRSDGNTANSGRQVENEADVLSAIELLLAERELGESLLVFNPDTYNTTESLIEFFTNDVLAIVGPHGGGLMNHRFAGPNVLVLEFLPTSRIEWINWEEVSVLNQTYAAIITEPIPDTKDDMIIEPSQVVDLLSRHIGTPGRMAGVSYDWDQE